MSEKERKRIAVLERALLIAARMFSDSGWYFPPNSDAQSIKEWFIQKAHEELRIDSGYKMGKSN